jgi:hypothetical protein
MGWGSGIRKKLISDPLVARSQEDTGSQIRIRHISSILNSLAVSGLNAAGGGAGRDELEGAERERPPRHRRVRLGGVRGKNLNKGILS